MASRRETEADRVETAFHAALTRIGVETVTGSLALWEELPPGSKVAGASSWLTRAVAYVMGQRRKSRDLARSYYRLTRALRTGATIQDPAHPDLKDTSLGELRRDFAERAGTRPSNPQEPLPASTSGSSTPGSSTPVEDQEDDDLDRILVEELKGIEEEAARIEREAEQEARNALAALGAANQQKKVEAIDRALAASEVDSLEEQAHKEAGARQAASSSRIAMNGARSDIWTNGEKDKRTVGYVRLSRTGTPCGWCAMLISRGPVYQSEGSASFKGGAATYEDGDKYHDNCNCFAMPIFSYEQYEGSDLYKLNRQYSEQWPLVTRGLSGKAAVSAWRRFIRTETQSRPGGATSTPSTAQEA